MTQPPMSTPDPFAIPDDDTLQPWNLRLSVRDLEWLRVEAFRRRVTKTDVIRELIKREREAQERKSA